MSIFIRTALIASLVAAAQGQVSNLISADATGSNANGSSWILSGSAVTSFGREIVFVSDATDLVPGDTQGFTDVFVRDRQTGATTRVSVTSGAAAANGPSGWVFAGQSGGASISPNGRYVAFPSTATNLDPSKASSTADIFLHDRDSDADGVFDEPGAISTTRISLDQFGGDADAHCHAPIVNSQGDVVYHSAATDLVAGDTNGVSDVFHFARATGTTLRVSVGPFGQAVGGASSGAHFGGSQIIFTSHATNLLPDIDGNGQPDDDTNGSADVFAFDLTSATLTRLSVATNGSQASGGHSVATSTTFDGRFVVFHSDATNLVGSDGNGVTDVFLRDRDTDLDGVFDEPGAVSTTRVSLSTASVEGNGASTGGVINHYAAASLIQPYRRVVAFSSAATNLVAGDTDGPTVNVFLRDLTTSQTTFTAVLPGGTPAQMGLGFNRIAIAPEGDGVAFAAGNTSPQQAYFHDFQSLDLDSDGLLDSWEIVGIDSNQDGTIDLRLPNADPSIRDVYVECDAMLDPAGNTMLPAPNTLATIRQMFTGQDGAPARLHLLTDPADTMLPNATWSASAQPLTWPAEFGPFKLAYFGTPAERSSPNWTNIRAAKLMAHRYCVFADQNVSGSIAGMGEMPGNDFFLTLGGVWAWWGSSPAVQAGVFLHELGHNLGLDHGGGAGIASPTSRSINYKPNYYSVMNYSWTTPSSSYASSWTGAYSPFAYNLLFESSLDEATGIGGLPGFTVPVGPLPWRLANQSGAVNWNRNATCCEFPVSADINDVMPPLGASPGQVLEPHDDWPNLQYAFGGNPNFNTFSHGATLPSDAYDYNTFQSLQGNGPWTDGLDNYALGIDAHVVGGWETWCDGGKAAAISDEQFLSPPQSLKLSFDGSGTGSDVAYRFEKDTGTWHLSMMTYVPSSATGSAYILGLNTYCEPDHNWSMQVRFNAGNSRVLAYNGSFLPMVKDQWIEFRAEIDLNADTLTEYYNGQVLADGLIWSQNVSGANGDPGQPRLRALDLFSQNMTEMYIDDLRLEAVECAADFNDDGLVNTGDFIAFLNAFVAEEPAADFNADGFINTLDFIDFLNAFVDGC